MVPAFLYSTSTNAYVKTVFKAETVRYNKTLKCSTTEAQCISTETITTPIETEGAAGNLASFYFYCIHCLTTLLTISPWSPQKTNEVIS